jgi:transposase InsO family protein
MHANARLTMRSREIMVRQVMEGRHTVKAAAAAFTVCEKTVRKWVQRYRQAGRAGLMDRSSKPRNSPRRIDADRHAEVWRWREQGRTYAEIAEQTGLSEATLSRILRGRRPGPPPPPVVRYERAAPGELLHLDIKKLGRIERPGHRVTGDRSTQVKGSGWECVHVCIDDHSRVAFAQIKADQKRHTAVDFLEAALACYASLGVKVQRIMTDNGPCYHSAAFRKACSAHGLKHLFTKPYTPQTNGKAERFIQSSLREWAYARPYNHSDERAAALPLWLHRYNWHRPHRSLNRLSPITRLNLQDNLLTTHN